MKVELRSGVQVALPQAPPPVRERSPEASANRMYRAEVKRARRRAKRLRERLLKETISAY